MPNDLHNLLLDPSSFALVGQVNSSLTSLSSAFENVLTVPNAL